MVKYEIDIEWHGRVAYQTAWDLQKRLVSERKENPALPGKLLLLEHPPTYTLGRNGQIDNLLLTEQQLAERGIGLYRVERGGDITYHGPGQLVGYPILNLRQVYNGFGLGRVREYVTDIEELLIQTLDQFGIIGIRHDHHRGVWVNTATGTSSGLAKIAAIGVRISGGISSHGFALNVAPNLDYFNGIIPCGINDLGVTSMAAQRNRDIAIQEVLPHLTTAFNHTFTTTQTPTHDLALSH
ncbi:MAG: lipoyl(octanoyl) transferase LipB [Candidatus Promineifilaceae bacterium]